MISDIEIQDEIQDIQESLYDLTQQLTNSKKKMLEYKTLAAEKSSIGKLALKTVANAFISAAENSYQAKIAMIASKKESQKADDASAAAREACNLIKNQNIIAENALYEAVEANALANEQAKLIQYIIIKIKILEESQLEQNDNIYHND